MWFACEVPYLQNDILLSCQLFNGKNVWPYEVLYNTTTSSHIWGMEKCHVVYEWSPVITNWMLHHGTTQSDKFPKSRGNVWPWGEITIWESLSCTKGLEWNRKNIFAAISIFHKPCDLRFARASLPFFLTLAIWITPTFYADRVSQHRVCGHLKEEQNVQRGGYLVM